jgi:capsular exopolysaccharide synthesis family protein
VVFTAMALFCSLGMGGGIAFLRASRDKTICAFKDMPQPTQAPFLGHVPVIRTTKPLGKSLCDEIEQNQFLLVESIRVLRTALLSRLKSLDRQKAVTVLVTSAGEGTGKSRFTMMLGKSIAQAGKKVLMIDTDFHKTTLSKRFDLVDKEGFIEVLGHQTPDGLPIFPTETPGLDVMPTGQREGNRHPVFEEIANGAFKSCIGRIRDEYDYDIILLDSAPVLPVADATILAGQVDGTIMVEREHVSQRTHVVDALARIGSTGGTLLGTVFVGSFGQERYGYGYGYGYGHSAKKQKV